jgi:hypothetical protein
MGDCCLDLSVLTLALSTGTGLASKSIKVGGTRQAKAYKTWYTFLNSRKKSDKEREAGLEKCKQG